MPISHRAGEFFSFSEGEYSDYSFNGLYRVLVDFDMADAVTAFLPFLRAEALVTGIPFPPPDPDDGDDCVDVRYDSRVSSSGFGAYLQRMGLAEPIDYDEIHVGSYGELLVDPVKQHARNRAEALNSHPQSGNDSIAST